MQSVHANRDRLRIWGSFLGSLVVSGGGVGLIVLVPHLVGATWPAIWTSVAAVPMIALVALVVLWFAGLLVHVPVLRAAMPGLSVRQALTLNLSGSAVSNLLPLGGPAGMGLGYAMARSWGFSSDRFASFTLSTNLWNALGKFAVGLAILAAAAAGGSALPHGLVPVLVSASAVVLILGVLAAAALLTGRTTTTVGHSLDRLLLRFRPQTPPDACLLWLTRTRQELVVALRRGWRTMSLGVLGYLLLQAGLLYGCLMVAGAQPTVMVVAVAFAVERLISLAPLTPGGAGVAELGTIGALTAFGVDPISAAAGVVIYRLLTFAMEIPVGGLLALNWLRLHRRKGFRHGPPVGPSPSERAPRMEVAA